MPTYLKPLCLLILGMLQVPAFAEETGKWISLFDGKTLNGWSGDERFWSVQDGAIVGRSTTENPCTRTTYLHHDGEFEDFELVFEIKLEGSGANSGMQYRSIPKGKDFGDGYDLSGYQADFDIDHNYSGILYETYGRGIAAKRGMYRHFKTDGAVAPLSSAPSEVELREWISARDTDPRHDGWHDYRIIANGPWLQHFIDGTRVAMVKDESGSASHKGIFALQLHQGGPMTVRARNIRVRNVESIGNTFSWKLEMPGVTRALGTDLIPSPWPPNAGIHRFKVDFPVTHDNIPQEQMQAWYQIRTIDELGDYRADLWTFHVLDVGENPPETDTWPGDRYVTSAIVRDGKPILAMTDYISSAQLHSLYEDGSTIAEFSSYTGGAHCCSNLLLIDVSSEQPRLLYQEKYQEFPAYLKQDKYGQPKIFMNDDTFAYWPSSYVGSPQAKEVLDIDPSGARPNGIADARAAMIEAPTDEEYTNALAKTEGLIITHENGISLSAGDLYQVMISWMYGGHPERAWQLLRDACKQDTERRNQFADILQKALDKSPYYCQLPWSNVRWSPDD